MFYCWDLHWVKENYYQEGLLYGDCVWFLMGVVLGVIIGNSVGKADDDRAGYWLVIILGKLLKTEPGNFEGFSLYWALFIIILCAIWVDACLLGMGI